MKHLTIFLSAAVLDLLWILWFHFAVVHNALAAAAVSALLGGLSLVSIGAALANRKYVPSYIFGLAVGTYFAVRFA